MPPKAKVKREAKPPPPPPSEATPPPPTVPLPATGDRVKVWWHGDQEWFEGEVVRVKPSHVPKKAKFTVLFDDDVTITHDATEGWQMADRPIALPEQGSRVRVFWEGDGEWFVGTVRKTNPRMKMYNVFYESDGATVAHTCKEVWTPAVDEGEDDDGDTSAEEEEGRPKAGLKVELLSPKGKERKPVISGQSSTPASPDKSIIFKGESLCLGGFADEAAALARRKRAEADRAAGRHPAPPRGKKRLLD